MRTVTIALPEGLYAELEAVAASANEMGYGPQDWACDLVASELAARRLPRVVQGAHGARIRAREPEPQSHRVLWPERRRVYA